MDDHRPFLSEPRGRAQYVHYVDEMPAVLADLGNRLHLLAGTNTDSGRPTKEASFEGIADFELERESLFDVLTECRVVRALTQPTAGTLQRVHLQLCL